MRFRKATLYRSGTAIGHREADTPPLGMLDCGSQGRKADSMKALWELGLWQGSASWGSTTGQPFLASLLTPWHTDHSVPGLSDAGIFFPHDA